jgi:predicted MFS family arabinose efflux permease
VPAVLAVTVLLLTGHQAMYTYIAPFAPGRAGLVLLVFGVATVAGIWITGIAADRYLRPVLLTALAVIAAAMTALGLAGRQPAALLAAAALWGAAFGGAPALLQTALIDAAGPARADVATALQTTVYNAGIAAGSLAGGLVLGRAGPAGLPWVTLAFSAAALGLVAVARRHAFPAARPGSPALTQRNQHPRPLDEAGTGTANTYCR